MNTKKYSHKSGAIKRKERTEKQEKIKKLIKIDQIFKKQPDESPSSSKSTSLDEANSEDFSNTQTESEPQPSTSAELNYVEENKTDDGQLYVTDKGNFPSELTLTQKRFLIDNGPCQPPGPYPRDANSRSFSDFYYTKTTKSGLNTRRLWLCYSQRLNYCYCQPCWLFSKKNHSLITGFNDWIHLQRTIARHEEDPEHNTCCALFDKWRLNKTIDYKQEALLRTQISFWSQILERIIKVSLILATCNMPFRGHDENIDSSQNPGLFLSVIKLISNYDPVLKELLESKTKNSITYLSPDIQNEIIDMLGNATKLQIIERIKSAPFFSIITDTTQDISKIDQLSQVVRYVLIIYENSIPVRVSIEESFLGFIAVVDQTAAVLTNQIIDAISSNGLSIKQLRGQSYDGAANMSGIYNGVQAKILQKAPNAPYVHCAAHNLNLVLNDSVKNVNEIRNFYDVVEQIYVFFGHSIKRWALLLAISDNPCRITLKKLTPTRWSSRHDALLALRFKYTDILKALSKLILTSETSTEITEAKSLKSKLEKFETVFLIALQSKLLLTIDTVSKSLQNKQQNIEKATKLFHDAFENVKTMRHQFNEIKVEAVDLAKKWGVKTEFENKRISRPKRYFDEYYNHYRFETNEDVFRINVFNKTLDIVVNQLNNRSSGIKDVYKNFQVLLPATLQNTSDDELFKMSNILYQKYSDDISENFSMQLLQFRTCFREELSTIHSIADLTNFILIQNFSSCSSYSEILNACVLFLTIPVSVATAERSFSKLKLIKTYLRNSMNQRRLSSLSMLSIENETANKLNVTELIQKFASAKVRKKVFT